MEIGGEEVVPDESTDLETEEIPSGRFSDLVRGVVESVSQSRRLHRVHWVILAFSLAVTIGAWRISSNSVEEKSAELFDREADRVMVMMEERLAKYEDALRSGVAAIQASGGDMTHDEWHTFATALQLDSQYPGVNGIGVIYHVELDERDAFVEAQQTLRPDFTIHPEHGAPELMPITYIEPEEINLAAIGLDMAFESNRYAGIREARDTGTSQITRPITLVQDERSTPGFLLFSPYYSTLEAPSTMEERRAGFIGAVYAPFIMSTLMEGTLSQTQRRVGVTIADGDDILYDENRPGSDHYDPNALYGREVEVSVYGRPWTFTIRSDQSFADQLVNNEPLLILVGGIVLDGSLLLLFLLLVRSNRLGEKLTEELTESNRSLAESNAELERFAYVAAHDLQTPLRGIGDLAEYLVEDLDLVLPPDADRTEVDHHLERIRRQTDRMTTMVRGVLAYSRIGPSVAEQTPTEMNFEVVMDDISHDLGLDEGQLTTLGPTRLMVADRLALLQVLQNLVGNAIEHHPNRSEARVELKIDPEAEDDFVTISVTDNGEGIDPRFHDRIFELFQSLSSNTNRTGIGLAIVKKIVEQHDGRISVQSAPGQGSRFTFLWPAPARDDNDDIRGLLPPSELVESGIGFAAGKP